MGLLIIMQYTSEFCAGTLKNNDVSHYEEALSRVIRSAQQSANCEGFWRNYIRLERIYNAVETLSFCALVMSIIHTIVKSSINLGKKKKKREGKNDQSELMVSLSMMFSSIYLHSCYFIDFFDSWTNTRVF